MLNPNFPEPPSPRSTRDAHLDKMGIGLLLMAFLLLVKQLSGLVFELPLNLHIQYLLNNTLAAILSLVACGFFLSVALQFRSAHLRARLVALVIGMAAIRALFFVIAVMNF